MREKFILGVTGGYGTGKTTVAGFFRDFGAEVVDADKIAHNLINRGTKVYREIIKYFGKDVLKKDKCIDRSKLAKIVFANGRDIARLNRIIHPDVKRIIKQRIKQSRNKLIVLDVPLLLETGLDKIVDKVIVVKAKGEKQFERLLKGTGIGKDMVSLRINSQMPLSEKVRQADFIIDNNGTMEQTRKQVKKLISDFGIAGRKIK